MRTLFVICCMLILGSVVVVAQNDVSGCEAGDPDRESPLRGHQVYFGLADNLDGVLRRNAELIVDEASVPDGVIGPDGRLWVYYINGVAGQHGIFVSVQQDDGSWAVLDCVKLDGEMNGNAVDPDIVRLDDGRYRLYYFEGNFVTPPQGPPSEDEIHPIYSAISEDGINFGVEGLAFELPTITDPTVVQLSDGTWLMAAAYSGQVAIAHSDNGLVFDALEPLDDDGIPELSLDEDGNVLLWGRDQWTTNDGGSAWEKTGDDSLNPDPSIVWLDEGGSAFFYKDFDPADMQNGMGRPPNNDNGDLPPCPPITENVTPIPCQPRKDKQGKDG